MAYSIEEIEGAARAPRYPQRAADSGVGLREIADALRRRWRTIALTTLSVMGAAALFILVSPTSYTASTQILIDPRDRRILGTEVMATSTGADPTLVESQLRIITSDAVLARVVAALKLDADPEFAGTTSRGDSTAIRAARTVATLRRRVTVTRAERTYVIDVSASAHSPEQAKAIADAVANAYLADQADADRAMTRRATEALTARLSELRANLGAAEDKAQAFRTAHGLVLAQGALLSEQELADLNRRLVQARLRTEEAQARYDQTRQHAGDPGGVSDVLGSSVITGLRAQLAEITRREAELSATLGDRHPALIEVRAQLANTRRLIGQEISRIDESAANELAVARDNEATISRGYAELTGRSQTDNGSLIALRDLERDVDAARNLYEAFLNRAKQTAEQELIATQGARILAPAATPLNASYPPALLVLLIALVCGAGLGATIALVTEQLDDKVRTPEDLRALTRLDVYSALPGLPRWHVGLLPRNAIAVRALRNALRDDGKRSALVVSAKDGEGAAATALDLAMAAAVGGERVLIADVDLSGRALSKLTCPSNKRGVLEVVQSKMTLRDAVHVDVKSGLSLLPVATGSAGRSKNISREQICALLAAARPDFDFVVLCGAPLLEDPDVVGACGSADNIALVVQAGATRRDDVVTAMRLLRPLQGKLAGAVLTASASAEPAPARAA